MTIIPCEATFVDRKTNDFLKIVGLLTFTLLTEEVCFSSLELFDSLRDCTTLSADKEAYEGVSQLAYCVYKGVVAFGLCRFYAIPLLLSLAIAVAAFPDRRLISLALVVDPRIELPALSMISDILKRWNKDK